MDLSKLRKLTSVIEKQIDLSVFRANEDQRRAKSNFWSFFMSGDALPPQNIDFATAARYGCDRRMSDWWDLEGFQDWFQNKDEFRQRVEFISDLALDELQLLIRDKMTNASAKVAAIKMVMELGSKLASKSNDKVLDEDLNNMSKQDLEKFIQDRVAILPVPIQKLDSSD